MRRTRPAILAVAALLALPALAAAHAHLESSEPAPGTNLDEPPAEVVLTFDGELQPDDTGFTVTDAQGNEVGSGELDLSVADRNVISGAVEISEPGIYTVSWTVVAADGHPESGDFSFGYRADDEIPPDEESDHGPAQAPDTAVRAWQGSAPLVLAGLLLIAAGCSLAARRLVLS